MVGTSYKKQHDTLTREKLNEILPTLPKLFTRFIDAQYGNGHFRVSTAYAYAQDLYKFFEYLKESNPLLRNTEICDISEDILEQLSFEDINEFLRSLNTDVKRTARVRSALSSFFTYCVQTKYLTNNPVTASTRPTIKAPKEIDRLGGTEIVKLLTSVEDVENSGLTDRAKAYAANYKLRDYAILITLLHTGIRVSELVGLDVSDIDFDESSMHVIRKGGTDDTVYFNGTVSDALKDYIHLERPKLMASEKETALFLSNRRQRMQVRSIQAMLSKYAEAALPARKGSKAVTPHKLRKTYGTALYDETGDIKLVADVLGHNQISTTAKYYIASDKKKAARDITLY